jgi:hypothetical protein
VAEFAWTRIKLFSFQFFKFVSDEDDSLDYGDIGENGDKPDSCYYQIYPPLGDGT